MTYSPGIPNATDKISQSQPLIKTNFEQLNTLFDKDHVKYDDPTVAARGRHKKVTFTAPIANPDEVAPIGALYTKTVAAKSELFFQNGNLAADAKQLTSSTILPTAGSGLMPNGLQIRSGQSGWPGQSGFVVFNTAFPTACVSVVVCNGLSGNNPTIINVIAIAPNQFQVFSPNQPGGSNLFYIATGY